MGDKLTFIPHIYIFFIGKTSHIHDASKFSLRFYINPYLPQPLHTTSQSLLFLPSYIFKCDNFLVKSREIVCLLITLLTFSRNGRSHSTPYQNFHRFCRSLRVREVTEESEHRWFFLQDNDLCLKLCVLTLYLSPHHHLHPFHFLFINCFFVYLFSSFPFCWLL